MDVETRELQLALLEMMKDFHKICCENNISYYMLGGTCLGAIRHSGFIPWDDDMDIGIPREDYDKLCRIANEILPSNLALRYYRNTEGSPFHFVKLINQETTLVEKNYKDYVEGIYIDVFPLDKIKKFGLVQKVRAKYIRLLHVLIMDHYYTGSKKSGIKNVVLKISKKLNIDRVHDKMEKLMTKETNIENGLYCNYLGAWKDREIIDSSVFGKPVLYKFEDVELSLFSKSITFSLYISI